MVHCGIDPVYVKYEMSFREAGWCLEAYFEKYKDDWEKTRRIVHMTAQTHARKVLKYTDALRLPWDKKERKKRTNKRELERLKMEGERLARLI